jgi:formamidopyrimidine-DNA glycosylase
VEALKTILQLRKTRTPRFRPNRTQRPRRQPNDRSRKILPPAIPRSAASAPSSAAFSLRPLHSLRHKLQCCKSAVATRKLIIMPELPDIAAYISALEPRIVSQPLQRVRLGSPFLLRTAQPPISDVEGRVVRELRRVGKRIAIGVEGDLWLVLHLMIAGRLHWKAAGAKLAGRRSLAAFDFPDGSLALTEAGTKHRASLHLLGGEEGLRTIDPGGIDIFSSDLIAFRNALTAENRTLKRALTDPRILSGIGNAYSDEILHAAQLSPITLTHKLKPHEWEKLFAATIDTIRLWVDRLIAEAKAAFPENVTAFRKDMTVHGRYGQPCPRCGEKIQRIRYADNETNYCARCQTGGKVLADRSLSRLLGSDWPRTLEELEALKRPQT